MGIGSGVSQPDSRDAPAKETNETLVQEFEILLG